jgi:hypothetical protein
VERLSDVTTLETVAKKAKLKSVRAAAKDKLPQKAEPGTPSPQAQRRAHQRQLCARVEAAAGNRELAEALAELEAARAEWAELGAHTGDDELRVRFGRAVERIEERRRAAERKTAGPRVPAAATAPVAHVAAEPEPVVDEAARAAAEAARREAETARREAEAARREADAARAEERAAAEERARKEREQREAARAEEKARREAEREANRVKLEELCVRLEALAGTDDRKQAELALKESQAIADGIGPLPRTEPPIRDRYDAARKAVVVRLKELREAEDWKRWSNVPRLEALCAKMEALALSGTPDLKAAAQELKEAQAEWKALGPAPREKSDALWTRFKTACDEVHRRCREHFAVLDQERTANLKKKEELCVRVEALVESTEWKEAAETIKLLQEEWKAVGPVPKEQTDALWKRFRGACDRFFERRKAHFSVLDEERAGNLRRQEELCVKVEALAGSTDWKATAELIKQYQADWKEIGPVPRAESEAMWKRFRAACDQFFDRRKEHFGKLDEERAVNLKAKELLCEKAEALIESDDEAAMEAVRALQAEWKTVGPAPRDAADAVWNRFRSACDRFFERRRRPPEPEPLPEASEASATGTSGFVNRLPLEGILERMKSAEPAQKSEPESAAAPSEELPGAAPPEESPDASSDVKPN